MAYRILVLLARIELATPNSSRSRSTIELKERMLVIREGLEPSSSG